MSKKKNSHKSIRNKPKEMGGFSCEGILHQAPFMIVPSISFQMIEEDTLDEVFEEIKLQLSDLEKAALYRVFYQKSTFFKLLDEVFNDDTQNTCPIYFNSCLYSYRDRALNKIYDALVKKGIVKTGIDSSRETTLSHQLFKELINNYLIDEIPNAQKFLFEEHMLACDSCSSTLMIMREITDFISKKGDKLFGEEIKGFFNPHSEKEKEERLPRPLPKRGELKRKKSANDDKKGVIN